MQIIEPCGARAIAAAAPDLHCGGIARLEFKRHLSPLRRANNGNAAVFNRPFRRFISGPNSDADAISWGCSEWTESV